MPGHIWFQSTGWLVLAASVQQAQTKLNWHPVSRASARCGGPWLALGTVWCHRGVKPVTWDCRNVPVLVGVPGDVLHTRGSSGGTGPGIRGIAFCCLAVPVLYGQKLLGISAK